MVSISFPDLLREVFYLSCLHKSSHLLFTLTLLVFSTGEHKITTHLLYLELEAPASVEILQGSIPLFSIQGLSRLHNMI